MISSVRISRQNNPNIAELTSMFKTAFDKLTADDQLRFDSDKNGQELFEWFDINQLREYFQHGLLIEARDVNENLVGAIFVGKQNPLSWPDGNKVEIFILGVDPVARGKRIGSALVKEAEKQAKKNGAKKIIVNTHVSLKADQQFYKKLGYVPMGTLANYYDNGNAVFFCKVLV
ncbi:GNAT family N-acetyltransferase [Patescibacteria group bacterium]|nr:GNAT family N-acetyltransferase [Patescibacteria group bacterium]